MGARISHPRHIGAQGTTIENEPIIKSDGAGEVMQWIPSSGTVADGITIPRSMCRCNSEKR